MKSFQRFFDDVMVTEIVTWINQKIEKEFIKSRSRFTYDTNETEVRAFVEILLFSSLKTASFISEHYFTIKH